MEEKQRFGDVRQRDGHLVEKIGIDRHSYGQTERDVNSDGDNFLRVGLLSLNFTR